jgi:hypothetical protein
MGYDNRIPSVVRDFTDQATARSVLSFLTFEDWLAVKETEASDWLVVARSWRDETTDFFTFSALVAVTEDSLKRILSKHSWEIDPTFGHPTFILLGEKMSPTTIRD